MENNSYFILALIGFCLLLNPRFFTSPKIFFRKRDENDPGIYKKYEEMTFVNNFLRVLGFAMLSIVAIHFLSGARF